MGDFQNKKQAETFMEEVLKSKYPNAEVIFYNNGQRVSSSGKKQKRTKPVIAPPR